MFGPLVLVCALACSGCDKKAMPPVCKDLAPPHGMNQVVASVTDEQMLTASFEDITAKAESIPDPKHCKRMSP